jgi:hypothetical protein
MIKVLHWSSCEVPSFLSDFNKLTFFGHIIENFEISNLMKIHAMGAELFNADGRTEGRTDGQTDVTEFLFAF